MEEASTSSTQETPQDGITFFERALIALAVAVVIVVYLGVCAIFSLERP